MNKVAITGGAGFIGSHLCKKLLDGNNRVICIDNLFTGSRENILEFFDNPHFEFIQHDIVDPIHVEADRIFNLACPASPVHYQYDPIKTLKTSVLGSLNMLLLAEKQNARILQASTSEIYGNPSVHPQPESYCGNVNPIGVRACYDEGKRAAETLFFDYQRQHHVEIKVMRIFNTYGPNMNPDDGRVVSNFITQALRGEDITIYGDGMQTRSFCYVDDLVDGMLKLMDSPANFTGPVNMGNPGEFTILELAEIVLKLIGGKSKIVFKSLPQDDPERRRPDITLAKDALGWEPKIALEDGLVKTIEYFRGVC